MQDPNYTHVAADLADLDSSGKALKAALEDLDLSQLTEVHFIHNAYAFLPVGLLPNLDANEIRRSIDVNLVSGVLLSQIILSVFAKSKIALRMIFISSPAATIGIPGATVYCATKAGVESLVRGIHSETSYYSNPVKCISFMPGRIDTGMQTEMRSYSKDQFPVVDRYKGFHEKGELQDPKKVAKIFCENLIERDVDSGHAYSINEF